MPRQAAADELYCRLARHSRWQLSDYRSQQIPKNGVYFFFEAGEYRPDGSLRVTRIGTHGKGTLPKRLVDHHGPARGGGSHRASIFRKLIGRALPEGRPPSWGIADRAAAARAAGIGKDALRAFEADHEQRVNERIREMSVICLAIESEADRRAIEKGAIALLSNAVEPFEGPSDDWLGRSCHLHPRVAASGLWNQHYVARPWREEPGAEQAFLGLIPEQPR